MKRIFLLCFVVFALIFVSSFVHAATSWYLPEGSTDGFDLWILVTNPNAITAEITFTFYRSGLTTVSATANVEPNNRYTLKVNDVSGIGTSAISTKVECTNGLQIYAERAMYWDTATFSTWAGGHTARGIAIDEGCYYDITSALTGTGGMTISRGGTYKLTENISFSTEDTDAITIAATNVTIDLNGFTITGPGNTSGSSGIGINCSGSTTYYNITIKNGTVRDFRLSGIHIGSGRMSIIDNVKAYNNGDFGIRAGTSCVVRNCIADTNGQNATSGDDTGGIYAYDTCIVENCTLNNNTGFGIYANLNNQVRNNLIHWTTFQSGLARSSGIYAADYNSILDNTVTESQYSGGNPIYGIYAGGSYNIVRGNNVANCGYIGIVLDGNENSASYNHITGGSTDNGLNVATANTDNYCANNTYDTAISIPAGNINAGTINTALSNTDVNP